jgi:hypothetical protein
MRNNALSTVCTIARVTNHFVQPGSIISGPTLPEAVEVLAATPYGASLKIIGRGLKTGRTYDPVLNATQLAQLTITADTEPFDGDARLMVVFCRSRNSVGLAPLGCCRNFTRVVNV